MGTYSSYISRTDVSSYLLPDQYSKEIIQAMPTQSFALKMMKRLPNMSAKTYKIPVLNAFASAYFVGEVAGSRGETNTKQTTDLAWTGVTLTAEEIACIVPVPESVLEDMTSGGYDLWGEVKPRILEAIGRAVDAAILYGTNKPTAWPDGIVTQATAKSNTIQQGAFGTDLYDDILSVSEDGKTVGLFGKVEEDGYIVNGALADVSMMGKLRGMRTQDGIPVFQSDMKESNAYRIAGVPLTFPNNGAFDASSSLMIAGDWSQAVYAVRKDITFKIATEAAIHDASGNLVYNLFQDDMVALRMTFRMGWALPNPKNLMNQTDGTRFPFAVLTPAST